MADTQHGEFRESFHERTDLVEEQQHFRSVCEAYRQYGSFVLAQWFNRQCRLQALSESQRNLLPPGSLKSTDDADRLESHVHSSTTRETAYKQAVIRNQFCLDCILRHAGQPHSQEKISPEVEQQQQVPKPKITDEQISKVSSVLKSLARDWSVEGKSERDAAYGPILDWCRTYVVPSKSSSVTTKICVPGSGVGRLALELRAQGYDVQGNDFSLYMLLASDFVLNNGGSVCTPERPLQISPWLSESSNLFSFESELRTVSIPDVDPLQLLTDSSSSTATATTPPSTPPDFSMAAGEFASIYSHQKEVGQWDCVASCFFLDACPNVIETIQVIYNMLRPGGCLINVGPLLYHWSGPIFRPDDGSWQRYRERLSNMDDRYLNSIDLSYQDIKEVMINVGFEFVEEKIGIECYYTADIHSMMKTVYQCVGFVARKRPQR